ncbi:unnamed protein product [Taenia asiatica]|uniref:Uncharacterized protein n=1 Tax=Taenia asiatica TaxID=60517 RepID=A0A0R3VWU7_TAEAS|nr:unnamed protein product [Taenia asiatica]
MLEHRFTSQSPHFHNSGSAESRPRATAPGTTYRPIRPQQNARTSAPATAMATSFSERLPSPVECLGVPQGVPVEGPVRETPITPTTVSPRPPIPPKTFTLLANDKQFHRVTAPPPIPRRNFQNTFPSASSPSSYSERFKPTSPHRDKSTSPPALPPRRASLRPPDRPLPPSPPPPHPAPVMMTSFSSIASTSTKRVSSTPDFLDGAGSLGGGVSGGGSTSSGSMFVSSTSVRTVESADCGSCGGGEAGVEKLTLLAFRPPGVFSRSNASSECLCVVFAAFCGVSCLESI